MTSLLFDQPSAKGCIARNRTRTSRKADQPSALSRRVRQLLETEIEFIDNSEFRSPSMSLTDPSAADADATLPASGRIPDSRGSSVGTLAALCSEPLLSAAEERELFRQLNYCKYRANVLRQRLDDQRPDRTIVDQIEALLRRAEAVRNCLLHANMRLLVSIAKRFAGNLQTLEDLVEEAVFTLLRAIERFDYDRGFRFSTYATRALHRQITRSVQRRRQEQQRCQSAAVEAVLDEADYRTGSTFTETRWEFLSTSLRSMLARLDPRERVIVRARFALGGEEKIQPLSKLAERLGVCKERVRQLEKRALEKLRGMADEFRLAADEE
jgi:RNA polymerase primary sigma factor